MKYSQQQLEHFYNTQHAGKLDKNDPDVVLAQEGSESRGNVIRLYLRIRNKKIVTARFLVYGTAAVTACCEYVCRYLEGKRIDEGRQLNTEHIMKNLDMSGVETHAAMLVNRLVKKSLC